MGSLAAVVANNLVNLNDDVLGNLGIYGLAIDYLGEGDALSIILCDRYFHLLYIVKPRSHHISCKTVRLTSWEVSDNHF